MVTSREDHAFFRYLIIMYASMTNRAWPLVLYSVRTFHGRNSRKSVFEVRMAFSTTAMYG
ncbi:MAG: hypothetical protein NT178_06685 [Proteobacteria bacterium]|nr:hypothetical protein [Pseudomonadota bacterium]